MLIICFYIHFTLYIFISLSYVRYNIPRRIWEALENQTFSAAKYMEYSHWYFLVTKNSLRAVQVMFFQ